jgi:ferredoxin
MASLAERLTTNVSGPYYVDESCIDCDQCRTMAPDFFGRDADSGFSFVQRQPASGEEIALVEEALSQCATASIGNDGA